MKELRKFKCLINETGYNDFGASGMVFMVASLKEGKIYTEADQTYYDRRSSPFFVDDNGCSRDIETMIYRDYIEEIR